MPAKPLTVAESKWLDRLENVMSKCPSSRLACYTIGDQDLAFFDRNVASKWELENSNEQLDAALSHKTSGASLRTVYGNFTIDSCAG